VTAVCCVKWRHGRHLENVTSYRISDAVNRCVFIREEHSYEISLHPIWNDLTLHFFVKWRYGRPSSWNYDVVAEISVNRCSFNWEQSCQISLWSDLKRRSLKLFWRGPIKKNKHSKISSNMRSVIDKSKYQQLWKYVDIMSKLKVMNEVKLSHVWDTEKLESWHKQSGKSIVVFTIFKRLQSSPRSSFGSLE